MAQLDLLSAPAHLPPMPGMTMPELPSAPSESTLPAKSKGAYKTISEVAEELGVPQHVLRFWESHFPQVKPSRMRGSRRYYRPEDVVALKTIKTLLYSKGYTIKGAKQVVRAGGIIAETPVHPAANPIQPIPEAVPPATSTARQSAAKKNVDKQSLVSELRVLKSMLTSLL